MASALSGLGRLIFRQDCVQCAWVAICAQLCADIGVAHCARNQGKGLEVFNALGGGRKQRKYQINGLPVDGIEVERFFKPQENTANRADRAEPCMRQCNAVANACWAKPFAFDQRIDDAGLVEVIGPLGEFAQIVEKPFLAGARVDGFYRVWVEDIAKEHCKTFRPKPARSSHRARVDPANISIVTPKNDVDSIMFLVTENEHLFVGELHLHHRFSD